VALLRSLGRDTRLAVFAFGLTYNAHLILGFFNFLAALPFVFFGLAAAVRLREKHTIKRMVTLGILLLVCFYMHVVPFAFLGLGATAVLIGDSLKRTVQRGIAFIPVTIAAGGWLASTPAGRATLAAAEATDSEERPIYVTVGQALRELPTWLTDILHRERDDQLLVAWAALLLFTLAVGFMPNRFARRASDRALLAQKKRFSPSTPASRAGEARTSAPPLADDAKASDSLDLPAVDSPVPSATPSLPAPSAASVGFVLSSRAPASTSSFTSNVDPGSPVLEPGYAWLLGLLSPIAFVAYFILPSAYEWIWPISGRFPLLALLFAPLLLPRMRGVMGGTLLLAAGLVAALSFYEVNRAFVQFEREEVGDIDAAIASIPKGERVAGLIFGGSSNIVRFAPFLHYVALYQARKGGAVMFTFAEFPQSPFRFRTDSRPPPVPPRWEWTPERVDPDRDLSWYRYVLVRGGPGRIQRSPYFENLFQGAGWTVWRRIDS
jgi:hypothetical protein